VTEWPHLFSPQWTMIREAPDFLLASHARRSTNSRVLRWPVLGMSLPHDEARRFTLVSLVNRYPKGPIGGNQPAGFAGL
jgi:hypothetical protein